MIKDYDVNKIIIEEMYKVSYLVNNGWIYYNSWWTKSGFERKLAQNEWEESFPSYYCKDLKYSKLYTINEAYRAQTIYYKKIEMEKNIENKRQLSFSFMEE